ncbi:MAG: ABC transporter ATP-binding protein [Candidatus Methanomethyliaceae archaeon]
MVIEVNDVWKKFRLRHDRADGVAKLFNKFVAERKKIFESRDFWALSEISFSVERNSSLGIVGVNGSGKSTMLKLLTGTLRPTKGEITVRGKKSSLIELGAGFHPDFSGRDNVYLNGLILGLSKKDISKRFEEIVAFAELEKFIDVPVKYYSSGMHARLAFSVATAVEPEILIIDEVLAVGDAGFKEKCLNRIADMQRKGVTVVLVSHTMGDIEKVCTKAIWIHQGRAMCYGDVKTVLAQYQAYS